MNGYQNNFNNSFDENNNISNGNTIKDIDKKDKLETIKIIEDYLIKETIGEGTFSTVKLGEHIKTKQKVAIKILNKEKIKEGEDSVRIKREIKILSMMDHPNIIKTYKISENSKSLYIIMEYCDGGELFDYIVKKEKLDENEASIFFFQLINALEYIHSLGIAHRDLKPENLLLTNNKIIKIIDFGLSNYFNGEKNLETPCGSPSYASPEIIKGETYNGFCIDIWASGIIMFAMLCGYLPFDEDDEENEEECNEDNISVESNIKHSNNSSKNSNENENKENNEILFQNILEGNLDFPPYLSDIAIDLMKKILVVDPNKRLQIKDIKNHQFYLLGKKNYFSNQKNNLSQKTTKKLLKIKNDNNYNNINDGNENINISKNIIHNIIKSNDNFNRLSSNSIENSSLEINEIKKDNHENNNISIEGNKNKEKNKIKNIHIKKDKYIKDEMEEYEKKLFENYLKNISAIRKYNFLKNKRKKKLNKKIKENKRNEKYSNILRTINVSPVNSYFNKHLKSIQRNKNNYTLNQIILDFNPNNQDIYKQITNSSTKIFNNKYNIPLTKINPIIKKNSDSFNRNNILYLSENNNNLNKNNHNLLTIKVPDIISSKRRNNTENKLYNDIKYYITNGNYKKLDESKRKLNNLKYQKFNSIDDIFDSHRLKLNKDTLPTIKPNLFNIIPYNSITNPYNREISFLNSFRHLKTEETNINNKKKFIYNPKKIDYNRFWNNSNNSINNNLKYKLFLPNYKKYKISTLK